MFDKEGWEEIGARKDPSPLEDNDEWLLVDWFGLLLCGTEDVNGLGCLEFSLPLRLCKRTRILVLFLKMSLL